MHLFLDNKSAWPDRNLHQTDEQSQISKKASQHGVHWALGISPSTSAPCSANANRWTKFSIS